jgi:hypothetical protein
MDAERTHRLALDSILPVLDSKGQIDYMLV